MGSLLNAYASVIAESHKKHLAASQPYIERLNQCGARLGCGPVWDADDVVSDDVMRLLPLIESLIDREGVSNV